MYAATSSSSLRHPLSYPPLQTSYHQKNLTTPIFDIGESIGEVHFPSRRLHCHEIGTDASPPSSVVTATMTPMPSIWTYNMPTPSMSMLAVPSDDLDARSAHCSGAFLIYFVNIVIACTKSIHFSIYHLNFAQLSSFLSLEDSV